MKIIQSGGEGSLDAQAVEVMIQYVTRAFEKRHVSKHRFFKGTTPNTIEFIVMTRVLKKSTI